MAVTQSVGIQPDLVLRRTRRSRGVLGNVGCTEEPHTPVTTVADDSWLLIHDEAYPVVWILGTAENHVLPESFISGSTSQTSRGYAVCIVASDESA